MGFRQTTICTASDDINSRIDGPAALNWIGAFGGVGGGWGRAAVATRRILEDLSADWRHLDARIEGLSSEIEALAGPDKAASD